MMSSLNIEVDYIPEDQFDVLPVGTPVTYAGFKTWITDVSPSPSGYKYHNYKLAGCTAYFWVSEFTVQKSGCPDNLVQEDTHGD